MAHSGNQVIITTLLHNVDYKNQENKFCQKKILYLPHARYLPADLQNITDGLLGCQRRNTFEKV